MTLLNITNTILRLKHFPSRWNTANITFIYWPTSLLPTISKVVEKIILSRLKTYSEELRVIPVQQFSFHSDHFNELQIRQFAEDIFLDVAKAFDRVWHEGLLIKITITPYILPN